MDFITDLPPSQGFNGVYTCVDKLTKWVKLVPMTMGDGELSAAAVARLFFDHVVRTFGVPHAVLHDRDPRFTSSFWSELWKLLGSRVALSSAYHPESDGQTERVHRTVEQVIRCLLSERQLAEQCWADLLGTVELTLNSAV